MLTGFEAALLRPKMAMVDSAPRTCLRSRLDSAGKSLQLAAAYVGREKGMLLDEIMGATFDWTREGALGDRMVSTSLTSAAGRACTLEYRSIKQSARNAIE